MYWLSPWMAKYNNRSSTTMGPLAIGMGINVSAYCSLSEVLSSTVAISAKAALDQSLLQLSYQQCRLERTTPSKITKTGVEVYLKARSRHVTIPVVDSVSQTYRFAPLQYSFRIKPPLNCKL